MTKPFDLIVIGGGINGAAIARDASMRGLKVILLEKQDFGSGASSKTSKLAHGGVRYLAQFHFSLVKESLKERGLLLKNAPHLVRPLPFIIPVYSKDPKPLWQINLGLYIYDFLSGGISAQPKHRLLSGKEVSVEFPEITTKDLKGACLFYDAQMQDNRIVIENVLSAESYGLVAKNYTEVTKLLKDGDKIIGVSCLCHTTGKNEDFYGHRVVNATGAWTENIAGMEKDAYHPSVLPTKGVHLVFPKFISEKALLLHSPIDNRVFFIIPWNDHTLVGTTDTLYNGDPDCVRVEDDDIDYLLKSLNHFFPNANLSRNAILTSFAGLRPLVDFKKKNSPSNIAREHIVHTSSGGLLTILGGKYTTHRKIAEEVVDLVASAFKKLKLSKCRTEIEKLPGVIKDDAREEVSQKLKNSGLDNSQIEHLLKTYGNLSLEIFKILQENPGNIALMCDKHTILMAEFLYSVRFEHVKTVADFLYRRTSIGYFQTVDCKCIKQLNDLLQTFYK